MAIKTILVVLSGVPGDETRLDAALILGARFGAGIVALHVKPSPVILSGGMGGEVPASLIEAQQVEIDRNASSIESTARAQAGRIGSSIQWRCEEGDETSIAGVHARYVDLVVAAPDVARDLVFVSASPVMAVPDGTTPNGLRHAVVAWNGSREAARAVRDALPLMEAVGSAEVLVIDPPGNQEIGVDIARWLASHGIKVDVRERLSNGADIGSLLLQEAKTSGADLLIMGAYGHSRLREWVLGGATEDVLDKAKIPVLMSH
uniref:Putative universal stress protein UspA n=1 Tax=uncultured bacterium 1114 TaxID=548901 RepID=B8R964_9BACT|nr:putative universal stress protein UspA [uncultured bacterium 1114]